MYFRYSVNIISKCFVQQTTQITLEVPRDIVPNGLRKWSRCHAIDRSYFKLNIFRTFANLISKALLQSGILSMETIYREEGEERWMSRFAFELRSGHARPKSLNTVRDVMLITCYYRQMCVRITNISPILQQFRRKQKLEDSDE